MSDLGAIFHVKKDGVQYDAHAYTTLDECPEPNLKINFKGQQGYVKLENNGSGDVPCYIKPKSSGTIYQVRKEATPTGSLHVNAGTTTFTVPSGVKVIKVSPEYNRTTYVGVTPNTVHLLKWRIVYGDARDSYILRCISHGNVHWGVDYDSQNITLFWSPEINKHATDITDY